VSLLLEALKKAELAKQQGAAGPQQPSEPAPPSSGAGSDLTLEPQVGASAGQPLMTRDRLPDITQPLEIFTEDLAPRERAGSPAQAPSAPAEPASPLTAGPPEAAERAAARAAEDAERASARQLFESKAGDYQPRRPFFLMVGALGVVTLGVVGYFAYQVFAPRPSFYTGPPGGKTPPTATVAAAPAPPPTPITAAAAPAAGAATTAAAAVGTSQGADAAPAQVAQAPARPTAVPVAPQPEPGAGSVQPPSATRPTGSRAPVAGGTVGALQPATPRPAPAARAPVQVTPSGPRVDPSVERGWEALQAGDLARAAEEYNRALRANPTDRDALLGLAAIDTRNQDFARAEARYLKLLELDPRDAYAQAALIGLRGGGEGQQPESRLKTLISQQPDSAVLSFALGNQYASQARWAEAQQAFFAAWSGDPENADYAYNLAVSLDHLRQPRLALEYYQRALKLAGNRPVGFNTAQVDARVRDLQR
jgi:tetratricopeptide (TPR) repeat protein